MKIWRCTVGSDNFERFKFKNDNDRDFFLFDYKCQSLKDSWSRVPIYTDHKGKKSDYPYLGANMQVFSEKAVERLRDLIEDKVELLPLIHEEGIYYGINVIHLIDAIDVENSEIGYFSDGSFSRYKKMAFKEEVVKDQDLFKIYFHGTKNVMTSSLFVSDRFRERVLQSDLVGFNFIEIWDSEQSHLEKEAAYQQVISEAIEGVEMKYTFEEALNLVLQEGKLAVSDKWALQK